MPTFGRVPKSGCAPLGYSLDHIGPMANSARDLALLLGILAGHDVSDPNCVDLPVDDYSAALTGDLRGIKIGIDDLSRIAGAEADPSVLPSFTEAIKVLEGAGAQIVPVELPYYDEIVIATLVTMYGEALAYHQNDLATRWDDYFQNTREVISSGAFYSAADYVQAQRVRRVGQKAIATLLREVDLVVTPTTSAGAPTPDGFPTVATASGFKLMHTPYWNSTGNPAASIPMGFTADGLPLGLQIAGPWFGEASVLRAADAFQRRTEWHLKHPNLP
jgi:aspartyl-tRNA(Asn)/glutamyl-tRNA(Gln) amidotransferase subunit A